MDGIVASKLGSMVKFLGLGSVCIPKHSGNANWEQILTQLLILFTYVDSMLQDSVL